MKLFAGVALNAHDRACCADHGRKMQAMGVRGRFERDEKLHLTLAFLGYVDVARLHELREALAACARRTPRFTLQLDKIGAFPHERAPRVVYIGSRDAGAPFRTAAAALRRTYAALGFRFPEDAVAHVTLARIPATTRAPLPALDVVPITLRIEKYTLFESLPDRERGTSRYDALDAFALEG